MTQKEDKYFEIKAWCLIVGQSLFIILSVVINVLRYIQPQIWYKKVFYQIFYNLPNFLVVIILADAFWRLRGIGGF